MIDLETAGIEPEPEFKGFMKSMMDTFWDVNKRAMA
jgi:hypothetical protein